MLADAMVFQPEGAGQGQEFLPYHCGERAAEVVLALLWRAKAVRFFCPRRLAGLALLEGHHFFQTAYQQLPEKVFQLVALVLAMKAAALAAPEALVVLAGPVQAKALPRALWAHRQRRLRRGCFVAPPLSRLAPAVAKRQKKPDESKLPPPAAKWLSAPP